MKQHPSQIAWRQRATAAAQQQRRDLIAQLGGKCARCGSTSNLELDHREGRDWRVTDFSQWDRIKRYAAEAAAGLLQVLCRGCNAAKGRSERAKYAARESAPLPDPDAPPAWVTEREP